ncbi:MAG: outer membrane protein assembly factor BamB family protein [Pirellulaceae bacterium]
MMVEQFIDRLEQQGLLDTETIADLRRKVAQAKGKKVTPEAIAKYLVDRGHLTRFQATKLVGDASSLTDVARDAAGKPKAEDRTKSDELRLLPRDEELAQLRDTRELPKPAGRHKPISIDDEVAELTAIDDDLEIKKRAERPAEPAAQPAAPEMKPHAPKRPVPRNPDMPPPPPVAKPTERVTGDKPLMDDLLADLESSGAALRGGLEGGGGRHTPPVQRKLQKTSEWDSMLLLVGGASLGVLLVIGAFLYMSLTRGAAEELFGAADSAYEDQSYSLAVRLYDEYLEAYPNHEKASLARVRREMARLRQVYKSPEQGVKVAQEMLPQIEQEESFASVRDELASMLPQIARGFVDKARSAKDPATQEALLAKTAETMKLVDNTNYIPATLRKSQLTSIDSIIEDMARVRREIERVENLNQTLGVIQSAVASGNTAAAYAARQELLNKHPGLDTDEQLLEAVLTISEKERERVQVVNEPLAAASDDPAPVQPPHALLAHRVGQAIANVIGRTVYTLAGGSVMALDATSGDVLWRRFVGFETSIQPLPLSPNAPGSDAIAVDQRRHDLMRLDAKTGKLVWRLAIGEAFGDPVILDDRLYVSGKSGKLYVVDSATGCADRHVQIPQPLEVATGHGVGRPQLYQVAEQDNLYVLSTETLECREVFYIGHRRGTITVPPVMALGYLFIVENAGPDFSFLHILGTDEQGLHVKTAQKKIRLRGQVLVAPLVAKDHVLVVTDRREIDLYEVDLNNATETPVTIVTQQNATAEPPIISYALMDSGYMWVANTRMAKYQVQSSAGKIPSEWVLDEQDVYLAPLQLLNDVILHVRRRQNAPGITVAATRENDKDPTWQTEIAVPLRGLFAAGETVDAISARGRLFRLTTQDFERSVVTTANATAVTDERLTLSLTDASDVGNGEWAFAAQPDFNQVVFYRSVNPDSSLRLLTLAVPIGDATLPPVPFAGGLLVPLKDGTLVSFDPLSGGQRPQAFHPSVAMGMVTQWNPPALMDGGQELIIANTRGLMYRVGLRDQSQLAELSSRQLDGQLVGPLAAVGAACYGIVRSGTADVVMGFAVADLTTAQQWPLSGRLQWGPQRVGDCVLLATDTELVCLDGAQQQRWKTGLPHAPLVGQTLLKDSHVLLATADGFVLRVDPASGNVIAAVDVGEPLAFGPVLYGDRLLVAGQSGVVFVLGIPSA